MAGPSTLDTLQPPAATRDDATPVIATRGLTKIFRDFWLRPRVVAVDSLDLDVYPGEVFGLLGPNGSGKSTTIKLILGLLFPTKGRIAVLGKSPTNVQAKQHLGYLPEESYLYRFLNARETLDYFGRLFQLEPSARRKRIDMLLDMVGLTAVQRRPLGEYSKGMQRRIGLAQALINDPQLLILDEPTTGLDPIGTRQIKDLILQLRDRGKTIVLCSHLLGDVEDVCDRVCILYGGKKRREGTVDELLTVDQSSLIETDALDETTIRKIDELLTREAGKSIRKVEQPRQRLEALFMDIVADAQASGEATSGAVAGGKTAEFLTRDAHLPEGDHTRSVLDELVHQPQPSHAETTSTAQPAAPIDTESQSVLHSLIASEHPTHSHPTPRETSTSSQGPADPEASSQGDQPDQAEPAPPSKPANQQADQEVLSELLGEDEHRKSGKDGSSS